MYYSQFFTEYNPQLFKKQLKNTKQQNTVKQVGFQT